MKNNYSVKEAAFLLGVSTNTVYSYLKEGKLSARRFGKGRFKIPYISLAPFIDLNKVSLEETKMSLDDIEKVSNKLEKYNKPKWTSDLTRNINNEEGSSLVVGVKDIAFYRLFKSIMLLGVGVIYLIMRPLRIYANDVIGWGVDDILIKLLPFLLILTGSVSLIGIANHSKFKSFQGWIHALTALILGYYSLLAIHTQSYGILVFSGSLLAVTILHLFSSTSNPENFTFFTQFTKYAIFLIVISGIIFILSPGYILFKELSVITEAHKGFFVLMWYGILIPILILLIKSRGRSLLLLGLFYTLLGVTCFALAAQLTVLARWDASYLSFITGVSAVLLAVWHVLKVKLNINRLDIIIFAFLWTASGYLFGLYTLRSYQEQIRIQLTVSANSNIENMAVKIENAFDNQSADIISMATDPSVKSALINEDTAVLNNYAKKLYESMSLSQRVVLYNSEGISVAIYPHLNLGLGTDFSEREYFRRTKSTNKGYISSVFKNILGENSIAQTEPIFENNRFIGMVGVFMTPKNLPDDWGGTGNEYKLFILDEDGVVVFSSDKETIGMITESEELEYSLFDNSEGIWVYKIIRNPNWRLHLGVPTTPLVQSTPNLNVVITVLAVVNAFFSLSFVLILSLKNGFRGLGLFHNVTLHES